MSNLKISFTRKSLWSVNTAIGILSLLLLAGAHAQNVSGGEGRMLLSTATIGANRGQLSIVNPDNGKTISAVEMKCDRTYFRSGVLACLHAVPGQGLTLDFADRRGTVLHSMNFLNVLLASRVRVSNDGALAAFTGFSGGHSYVGTDFSTRTYIIDVKNRRVQGDVGTFKVIESTQLKLPAKRINVWGVSFDPTSANRFVVTVGSAGQAFLAQGDIKARTLTLLRTEMECPSYSPDGKRIAFKRRNPAGGWWPAVYELDSGREWVMKEDRSIDDQIEWLDNDTLAYELPHSATETDTDIVVRKADGKSPSKVLLMHAGSPSIFE